MSKRFAFLAAAAILAAAVSMFGQKARPDFNRASDYDVQNYTIRVRLDRKKQQIFGDTTVSLKPTKPNFRSVELDAVNLVFTSVKLEGSEGSLSYRTTPGKVIVTLDKSYQPGDEISIRFAYSTVKPKKGIYFRDAEHDTAGVELHSSQIWTQGEAEEARYWFPSFDFPSDKATTEEYITAQPGETVIGNGEFLGKETNSDGSVTWHYKMSVPHSTYLVSFAIGKYARVDDKYKDIPLGYYVYPTNVALGKKAFSDTPDMMRAYERLTGVDFPYNKYDQTIVAKFQFGGMENITATTMSDVDIMISQLSGGGLSEDPADPQSAPGIVIDLVSHELAHSWFGDLVTCRNWAELWLNEGFATFMESAYREQRFGRKNYMTKVELDAQDFLINDAVSRARHPLFDLTARDADRLFDDPNTTYHKGGAVIHQLREQVGNEAFWKGINSYLNEHKFGNVESTDLRKAMEKASGQDLKWFFDQWVYSAGAPSLRVAQAWHPKTQTLAITFTQVQKADAIVPAVFRLPLDIRIYTAVGEVNEKVDLTKRSQVVSFKLSGRPSKVEIDPEDKIPLKNVTVTQVVGTPSGKE